MELEYFTIEKLGSILKDKYDDIFHNYTLNLKTIVTIPAYYCIY